MFRKHIVTLNDDSTVAADDNSRAGNVRWGLIAMLLGAPLPVILLAFLFMNARGCQ